MSGRYQFDATSVNRIVKNVRRAERLPHSEVIYPRYRTRRTTAAGGGSTLVTFLTDATVIPAAELAAEVTTGSGDKTVGITPGEFDAFLFSGDIATTQLAATYPDLPTVVIKNYYLDRYLFPAGVWVTGNAEEIEGEYVLVEISCAYQIKE